MTFSIAMPAVAGEFTVNPIRLDLSASLRSGVISVRNDGKEKLSFQMTGMEWTQDTAGKDQYLETRDLLFFPKVMTVDPGDEGIIRVGTKIAALAREKTYRLFIDELPGAPSTGAGQAAQVSMLIRFGAPVFVRPLKPEDSLGMEQLDLVKGELSMVVKNTGNQHQLVEGIRLKGTDSQGSEVYTLTLADRYLLAGTVKRYSTSITQGQCSRISKLAIEFKTDKTKLNRELDVRAAMCF